MKLCVLGHPRDAPARIERREQHAQRRGVDHRQPFGSRHLRERAFAKTRAKMLAKRPGLVLHRRPAVFSPAINEIVVERLIDEKKIGSHPFGALGFRILPSPSLLQRGPRIVARVGQSKLRKAPERHGAPARVAGQAIKEPPGFYALGGNIELQSGDAADKRRAFESLRRERAERRNAPKIEFATFSFCGRIGIPVRWTISAEKLSAAC